MCALVKKPGGAHWGEDAKSWTPALKTSWGGGGTLSVAPGVGQNEGELREVHFIHDKTNPINNKGVSLPSLEACKQTLGH